LGLWRADGTIEYLARIDDQVKIRGYRVEPAEIEHHIRQDPTVKVALVVSKELGGAGQELVAYVTMRESPPEGAGAELRDRLKRSLPDYMVPAHVVYLDRMPLNANGKVDRKALPDPAFAYPGKPARHEDPATQIERDVLAIWEEVLGQARIGVTDNFFDWGGHSLRVTKVVSLIERRLGVAVPLTAFFTQPTVRGLSQHIVDGAKFGVAGIDEAMVPLNVGAGGPNLFAFPPGTGDALGFVQIASLLPCRFYGFNFIEAESRLQDYADLISRVDAEGPYVLFGYSSGGNLAYHVARELEQRGRQVAGIIMVDSARKLQPTPICDEEIEGITNDFLGEESVRPYLASPVLREKARRLIRSSLSYVGNAVDYHMIDADIHVVTSEDPITEYRDAAGTVLISQAGWADVTRGRLRIRRGRGHHNYMLVHPHLDGNTDLLRESLDHIMPLLTRPLSRPLPLHEARLSNGEQSRL
jgi:tyrocidine synthetase-3